MSDKKQLWILEQIDRGERYPRHSKPKCFLFLVLFLGLFHSVDTTWAFF